MASVSEHDEAIMVALSIPNAVLGREQPWGWWDGCRLCIPRRMPGFFASEIEARRHLMEVHGDADA